MIKVNRKITLVLFVFCINLGCLKAQEKSSKLTNDLNSLVDKSNSFQEYKVINKSAITNFQASLNSYIKQEQSIQINLENEIKANGKWKSDFASVENTVKENGNNRFVFGISFL